MRDGEIVSVSRVIYPGDDDVEPFVLGLCILHYFNDVADVVSLQLEVDFVLRFDLNVLHEIDWCQRSVWLCFNVSLRRVDDIRWLSLGLDDLILLEGLSLKGVHLDLELCRVYHLQTDEV